MPGWHMGISRVETVEMKMSAVVGVTQEKKKYRL